MNDTSMPKDSMTSSSNPAEKKSPGHPVEGDRAVPSTMTGWHVYFALKLLLFWRGLIDFHTVENLGFFIILAMPLAKRWRRFRLAIAIPAAIALLYYDSFLPPITRLFTRAGIMADFSMTYMIELIGRFISWPIVAMMVIVLLLIILMRRFIRFGVIVLSILSGLAISRLPQQLFSKELAGTTKGTDGTLTLAASSLNPSSGASFPKLTAGGSNAELNRILQNFYATESKRIVRFPQPTISELPFDILFIHVCSLSWDDMQAAGMEQHPLWKSFDIVFRHFNSAASYSGPAAIRVNRATCGQSSNEALYSPAAEQCYLMPSLKRAGYDIDFAMNHDGHFDDFLQLVRQQGVQAQPMSLEGIPATMKGFDDSPIHDDAAVLARWRTIRGTSTAERIALYYNTISLHDGNRFIAGDASGLNSQQSYKIRLTKLFDEMEALIQSLASGTRRTVLVLIPEHGAALRGDRLQIAGLREIATPPITTVPVGIKVIDPAGAPERDTEYVDTSTSFLALSQVIANMLEKSPFGSVPFDAKSYVKNLPTTDYVAENEAVVMRVDNRYFWREDRDRWKPFPIDMTSR
jgi:cellulose synthase operon protein YhjU